MVTISRWMIAARRSCVARGLALALALVMAAALPALAPAAEAQTGAYRVNGETVPPDMSAQMAYLGLPPGDYYIDRFGNFGMVGYPPVMNASGGPVVGQGQSGFGQAGSFGPVGPGANAPQPAAPGSGSQPMGNDGGLTGTRMFWIQTSMVTTGGASGYFHLCPGGVFYRSSEGSFSVGGDYNSRTGSNDPWAGGAGVSRGAGQWSVQGGTLYLRGNDGSQWSFRVSDVQRGTRWRVGQFRYAAERGRATCPR
jgi:hypothetical protein